MAAELLSAGAPMKKHFTRQKAAQAEPPAAASDPDSAEEVVAEDAEEEQPPPDAQVRLQIGYLLHAVFADDPDDAAPVLCKIIKILRGNRETHPVKVEVCALQMPC